MQKKVAIIGLLYSEVASKMVHHVAFGPKALPTPLRAVKGPLVVVYAHMDEQIVPIIKRFLTGRHSAYKFGLRLMIGEVCLEALFARKLFCAGSKITQKDLRRLHTLP